MARSFLSARLKDFVLLPINFSICGLEGSSKSTSIKTINSVFEKYGYPLEKTREPGGTATADRIRNLIKEDVGGDELTSEAELLLFFASRMQTKDIVVRKNLINGVSNCSDRSWWCSFAYQAFDVMSNDLLDAFYFMKNRWENGGFKYDAVLFLDVDPALGLVRAKGRGELDRIERKDLLFFERARRGYLHLASVESNVTTICANGSEEDVQEKVRLWAENLISDMKASKIRNFSHNKIK